MGSPLRAEGNLPHGKAGHVEHHLRGRVQHGNVDDCASPGPEDALVIRDGLGARGRVGPQVEILKVLEDLPTPDISPTSIKYLMMSISLP
jgi:hypothetical protein